LSFADFLAFDGYLVFVVCFVYWAGVVPALFCFDGHLPVYPGGGGVYECHFAKIKAASCH
jgi:hypothetical protein